MKKKRERVWGGGGRRNPGRKPEVREKGREEKCKLMAVADSVLTSRLGVEDLASRHLLPRYVNEV